MKIGGLKYQYPSWFGICLFSRSQKINREEPRIETTTEDSELISHIVHLHATQSSDRAPRTLISYSWGESSFPVSHFAADDLDLCQDPW